MRCDSVILRELQIHRCPVWLASSVSELFTKTERFRDEREDALK